MMALLMRYLPQIIAAIAIATILFGGGWCSHKVVADRHVAILEAAHAREINEAEKQRTQLAQAALVVSEGYRDLEARWTENQDAARKQREEETAANARRLGELARAGGGLRDEAARLAAGRAAAEDSIAECRRNAATLRDVLGDVEQAGRAMAGHAETWAARVRQLEAEWPK